MWECGRQARGDPLHNPTKNPIKMWTMSDDEVTRYIPIYQSACKNSRRILWMKEFLNTETHTRVLLMDHLLSHRENWHRASTVFTLISRKTEISRSVRGLKLQGLRAEDVLVLHVSRAENYDDLIRADHEGLSEGCESRNNYRYAVVVQDLATQWIQSYPCETKTFQETERNLQKFLEPTRKPKVIYTDNSLEFGKACEDLSWNHCTSTPHRSETNGIAERAIRRIKEGTSAVLLQSGLDEKWWADSMESYCYLRHIEDLLSDGKTPCGRRLKGPIIPFGSFVEYHPFSTKYQSRIHQFGKKVQPGTFLGYVLYAGEFGRRHFGCGPWGVGDESEIHAKRLNAKEVITHKKWCKFHILGRRWKSKIFGRRSGTENIHLDTGSPDLRRRSSRFSVRIRRVSTTFSRLMSRCRWSTKWFLVHFGRLHLPPSRWTKGQALHAERRFIFYSIEIYWRHQGHSHDTPGS